MTDRPPVAMLSFPKCGRTWLKLMLKFYFERSLGLGSLDVDREHEWHHSSPELPTLRIDHDGDPHFKTSREIAATDRSEFDGHRILFVVRDPRDVMVSLFFEMTRRVGLYDQWGYDTTAVRSQADSISEFLRGPTGRLESLLAYWRIWDQQRTRVQGFLPLRYEDLHGDTAASLRTAVQFLGLQASEEAIAFAVERCHFDRMRKDETSDEFRSPTLRPTDPDDPESFKTRRGKVAGFFDYLAEDDIAYIDAQCRDLPDWLSSYRETKSQP